MHQNVSVQWGVKIHIGTRTCNIKATRCLQALTQQNSKKHFPSFTHMQDSDAASVNKSKLKSNLHDHVFQEKSCNKNGASCCYIRQWKHYTSDWQWEKMGASVSKHIPLGIPLLPSSMTTKRQSERDTYFESTYEISILEDVFTVQDK